MNSWYQSFLDRIPLLYVFLSGIGFSIQALVIKILSEKHFQGSLYCVTTRGVIQCLMSIIFIYFSEERRNGTAPKLFGNTNYVRIILFLRSVIGFGSIASGYLAIEYIAVGDSTVLVMLSPMLASILSFFILGEPWKLPEFIGTLLSLTGAVFVARPPFLFGDQDASDPSASDRHKFYTGVCIALFASLNASFAFIFVRILGTTAKMPWPFVTFSQSLAQIFLSPVLMYALKIPFNQTITLEIAILIIFGALIGAFSQAAMTIGMQREKSASATAMRMSDVVFGFIWQAVFTSDPINKLAIIGAFLVSSSILIVVIFKPQTPTSLPSEINQKETNEIMDTEIEMIESSKESIPSTHYERNVPSGKVSATMKKSLQEIIAGSLAKLSYARQTFLSESTTSNSSIDRVQTRYSRLPQVEQVDEEEK